MKVLHLLSSTGYHGAENMVAQLVKALAVQGVSNAVGVFYGLGNSNREVLKAVQGHVFDDVIFPCRKRLDISAILALRRYILKNDIDIVHSHKYKTNLYSLVAVLGTHCKLISTCHNWLGNSLKMKFYAALDKQVLRAFDVAVGVSTTVERELIKYLPRNKVRKIENGVDLGKFSNLDHTKNETKQELGLTGRTVVGYVGRLSEGKGIQFLIKALVDLIQQKPNVSCLIVGDGEYSLQLKALAQALGLSDKVLFTGRRNDVPRLYSAMDIFVLPSLEEAFPMVILEAMATGVPVVATGVGDIPRIIEDGSTGLIVKSRSSEALSQALTFVLENQDQVQDMATEARRVVEQNYSSDIMARRYKDVYKQVISNR